MHCKGNALYTVGYLQGTTTRCANPFQCTDADVLEVYASTMSIVDRGLHKKDYSE